MFHAFGFSERVLKEAWYRAVRTQAALTAGWFGRDSRTMKVKLTRVKLTDRFVKA
jgi:hypothetical protein